MALGLVCYGFPFAAAIERLSFDLPFALRNTIRISEAVIVYLDEDSARALGQPLNDVWDRSLHTRLLARLTRDQARLVYYDIVFASPSRDGSVDHSFAEAMRTHGRVVLGGAFESSQDGASHAHRIYPPLLALREAAAGWGVVLFKLDPDFAVRELLNGVGDHPSASWVAAEQLGAEVTRKTEERLASRWLNYYGPPGSIPSVSFHQALHEDGVPAGFFNHKIVFVGGRPALGGLNLGRDEFANPYSRWGRLFSPGVEVHATELLNLVRKEWLQRMNFATETTLLLILGVVIGLVSNYLVPKRGLITCVVLLVGLVAGTLWLVWSQRVWFNWLIPAGIQIPLGLAWSSGSQYFHEARRRAELRRAFSYYLSPHMADRISEMKFDLKPGGRMAAVTVLFTDCKGFTSVAEELNDPLKVSELLIDYFTQTSRCVLENDGTVIKYIGDCVMAVWGAPIDDAAHPFKAVRTGLQMSEASKLIVRGRVLTTRVGISTGEVAAGNLGSPFRFDYTVTGDTVNLASRLEGLNKMVGTAVLISESTCDAVKDRFETRLVGHFAVAGKGRAIGVHEVLSLRENGKSAPEWVDTFSDGLTKIRDGDFEGAKTLFRRTVWARGGADGPSEFYIQKIAELDSSGRLAEWTGVIRLKEK